MSSFKAKMHQIQFRLGLGPRPRWESLQRSSSPTSWILDSVFENTYFTFFFQIKKKHDFLRFFKMTCQKT